MGSKLHWTQRPENRDKVKNMAKKGAKTKTAGKMPKKSTKHQMLVDLAVRGARQELRELNERIITLQLFLKGVGR